MMKKMMFVGALLLAAGTLFADVPYVGFGKSSGAKIKGEWKRTHAEMEILPGNPVGCSGWFCNFTKYWFKPGTKLTISLKVKAVNVKDHRAKVNLSIQAFGEKLKYLNAKSFGVSRPAAEFAGEGKVLTFEFVMPDPAKTQNWANGKMIGITFGASSGSGKFIFSDYKEKIEKAK